MTKLTTPKPIVLKRGANDADALPPFRPTIGEIRSVLQGQADECNDDGLRSKTADYHVRAIRRNRAAWATGHREATDDAVVDTSGNIPSLKVDSYRKAFSAASKEAEAEATRS